MFKALKKIFSKQEQEQLGTISADDWLLEFSESLKDKSSEKIQSIMGEINTLSTGVSQNADKLINEELVNKNIPSRVESIMEGNRQNYVKRLKSFMGNIRLEDDIKLSKGVVDKFQREFENFSESTKKAYFVLKDFFYNNLLEIVESLKSIDNLYKNLGEVIGGKEREEFEELKEKIKEYRKNLSEAGKAEDDIKYANEDIDNSSEKIGQLKKKKESLKLSGEYQKFKNVYEQKENTLEKLRKHKEKFLNSFHPIIPALKKYKRGSLKERLIDKYIEDPFSALTSDMTLEFNEVLNSLENAVLKKEIDINEKKKDKIIRSVQKLITDKMLHKTLSEYKDLTMRKKQFDEQLNRNKIMMDISDLDYKIEHLEDKVKRAKEMILESQEKIDGLDCDGNKRRIEAELEEFAGRKVKVI